MHRLRLRTEDRSFLLVEHEKQQYKQDHLKWVEFYKSKVALDKRKSEIIKIPKSKNVTEIVPFKLSAYRRVVVLEPVDRPPRLQSAGPKRSNPGFFFSSKAPRSIR